MLSRYPIALAVWAIALSWAAYRGVALYRVLASSTGAAAPDRDRRVRRRAAREAKEVLGHSRLLSWSLPGVAHLLVFWGFVVLLLTVVEAFGDLFSVRFALPGIGHLAVVGFSEDVFALAVLVAVLVFAVIRLWQPARDRSSRFYGSHSGAAWTVLGLISAVVVTLLIYRGAQANTGDLPYGSWAFVSHGLGHLLHPLGVGGNRTLETTFVDLNASFIAVFLVVLVYSKHLHIFLAPLNIAFARQPRALGALATTPDLDPDRFDDNTVIGVGRLEQFNWKQLLDFATCTECGRCQSVCPAWLTGKPLSPKLVVMALADELRRATSVSSSKRSSSLASSDRPPFLVPSVIDPDVLWSCTTCGACVEQCPVDIEHVDAIVDIRRYEVSMESRFPAAAGAMLRNIERRGDPFGIGQAARLEWTEDLAFDVEIVSGEVRDGLDYLLWVGCAGALDERGKRTTQALARLLHHAGLSFAILGSGETCLGDPARRLGNEFLFQTQAAIVIDRLQAAKVHKVVASCPHCFNTIANEFPALGGNFEVLHHTQLLSELVASGRIVPRRGEGSITYHDPCYLGRHNRIFDEPREVLDAVPETARIEMSRARERSFCCGAGGARMWLEESIGTPINLERVDEAISTGADVIATACPYCRIMLDDAVRTRGEEERVEVLDIALLLERSLPE